VRSKNIERELFEDSKEEKKDTLNYGYLNSFYTELMKEKMTYFVEPLPLQGMYQKMKVKSVKLYMIILLVLVVNLQEYVKYLRI
jgi:hypothetical protein